MSRAPIPLSAPVGDPGSDPLVAAWISASWLPYLIGVARLLAQSWYWYAADPTIVETTTEQALCLINNVGQAGLGTQRGPRPIVNGGPLSPFISNGLPGLLVLND